MPPATRAPGTAVRQPALALALAIAAAACATPLPPAPEMQSARLARDVAWLADDARGGRGAGSPGLEEAARYLAEGFRVAGFEPAGSAYRQAFEMPVEIRVAHQELRLAGVALRPGSDFGALASSADGASGSEVVFAGYGITSPHHDWDDYAGLDVEGRIALVLDDRPGGRDGPLRDPRAGSFLLRSEKVANARRHGAAAVLLAPAAEEILDAPDTSGEPARVAANPATQPSGIVSLWLSRDAAERIVASANGASLAERQRRIDESGAAASAPLPGVDLDVGVEIERVVGTASNVVAIRRGVDPELRHEAVVIGAHYDHLGRGPYGSLTPARAGEVHNGADDNASGAAGLLELARAFAAAPPTRRTLVLAAFAGEELGLAGSRAYVEAPPVALADTIAMLNLDMIGRLRDGQLIVFGTETSAAFPELVRRAAAGLRVDPGLADGGYAPSDQTSFHAREIPVLHFFTGTHAEYHTPDDDADRVDAEGATEVLRLVYHTARALLDADERPALIRSPPPAERSGGPGYGPYLGTVPDFVAVPGPGVRIQAVRAGSPAERAGLRAGDRIIELDGASVANLEEFAARLFGSRAGDEIEIVVLRDGERIATRATLGRRR